ncbi:class I SAM-dependent methyltransferase [Actinokineospora auranticolor]|uniref:Methyltransferase family protein n=1 Tax=Actinokineospora auranticolor TaxID=155976 RepID=A0A2S6GMD3_9PSEU|nr:class I SAM-dependent methyltransferase [Actinokineospora auranticolor]PPK66402.1 methyltransferase family protein [Actinokineospora auranticolor]
MTATAERDPGFGGEVPDFYHRFRRGYPDRVVDVVVAAFDLTPLDAVVDLGCGTGQLTRPLAPRVGSVLGVDPEPDMLVRARAVEENPANVGWLLGSDAELSGLAALLRPLGAITVGQALHWMDRTRLFATAHPLLRPGGGVAVVTNGVPLWQQDSDWSRALRGHLSAWLGKPLIDTCGTDPDSQRRVRDDLRAAGYAIGLQVVGYAAHPTADEIIGGVYSALPHQLLPAPADRPDFDARLRAVLDPFAPFTEYVEVTILTGARR